MTFDEIQKFLADTFPFIDEESAMISHDVKRRLAHIVIGNVKELESKNVSDEFMLTVLKNPFPSEIFSTSFPLRPYSDNAFETRLIQDVCKIAWKGFGQGELLFRLKSSISERTDNKTKPYQVKHLASMVSLNPRRYEERATRGIEFINAFDGGLPGELKRGKGNKPSDKHFRAIEVAKATDTTSFFQNLYGWPEADCRYFHELLQSGCDPNRFRQELGVRIHKADAELGKLTGYVFLTDQGFIHLLTKDISVETSNKYGLKYSIHFKRGKDTQATADGYAKVKSSQVPENEELEEVLEDSSKNLLVTA
jgi:hypothetical protein